MHSFYKEHEGSYAVGIPWPTINMKQGPEHNGWHVLFRGMSLQSAVRVVNALNGGECVFEDEELVIMRECAA